MNSHCSYCSDRMLGGVGVAVSNCCTKADRIIGTDLGTGQHPGRVSECFNQLHRQDYKLCMAKVVRQGCPGGKWQGRPTGDFLLIGTQLVNTPSRINSSWQWSSEQF